MVKHSGSWYRQAAEVVAVLNLQKSQYGLSYYVNIGFWIKALGEVEFPKEHTCHVRLRLGDLVAGRADELPELLDLERDVLRRIQRLRDILEGELKPFVECASSLDGLRQLREEGRLATAFVLSPAISLLTMT